MKKKLPDPPKCIYDIIRRHGGTVYHRQHNVTGVAYPSNKRERSARGELKDLSCILSIFDVEGSDRMHIIFYNRMQAEAMSTQT